MKRKKEITEIFDEMQNKNPELKKLVEIESSKLDLSVVESDLTEIINSGRVKNYQKRIEVLEMEFLNPFKINSSLNSVIVLDQNILTTNKLSEFSNNILIKMNSILRLEDEDGNESLIDNELIEVKSNVKAIEDLMLEYESLNSNNIVMRAYKEHLGNKSHWEEKLLISKDSLSLNEYLRSLIILLTKVLESLFEYTSYLHSSIKEMSEK